MCVYVCAFVFASNDCMSLIDSRVRHSTHIDTAVARRLDRLHPAAIDRPWAYLERGPRVARARAGLPVCLRGVSVLGVCVWLLSIMWLAEDVV